MPFLDLLPDQAPAFRTQASVRGALESACRARPDIASFHVFGQSEAGRPLYAVILGRGPRTVSLLAGSHADEPAGPETLRTILLEGLDHPERIAPLLEAFRFVVIPHVNPDGEARNRPWIEAWPDPETYLKHRVRELPGRDVEFGYPEMRVENEAVSAFLASNAPFALHMSLHGLGIADGAMLLIERHWGFRTEALQATFAAAAREAGFHLHDNNRKGEKGFFYLGPGFMTTPEGEAMRTYFRARGEDAMAARFHSSSMEYVRSLGGDPLCLVTELPLFAISRNPADGPGEASSYRAFRAQLPDLVRKAQQGESVADTLAAFGIRPTPPSTLLRIQLLTLDVALRTIAPPAAEGP